MKMELSEIQGSSSNIDQILPDVHKKKSKKSVEPYKFRAWYAGLATFVMVVYEIIALVVYSKVYDKVENT